jgi:hypothetical protein
MGPAVTLETVGKTGYSGHSGEIRDMMAAVQGNVEVSRISRSVVFDPEIEINRGVPPEKLIQALF